MLRDGEIVAVYDEGFAGVGAITDDEHGAGFRGATLDTTAREYRRITQ